MQLAFWEPADDAPGPEACSDSDVDYRTARAAARGAEYLVAADLSFAGYGCFFAAEGMRYDLVVDGPVGLRRVQVKSTAKPRAERNCYSQWSGRHIYREGYIFDGGNGSLADYVGDIDIFAFVALDLRRVMYAEAASLPRRLVIKPEKFTEEICRLSLQAVLAGA